MGSRSRNWASKLSASALGLPLVTREGDVLQHAGVPMVVRDLVDLIEAHEDVVVMRWGIEHVIGSARAVRGRMEVDLVARSLSPAQGVGGDSD